MRRITEGWQVSGIASFQSGIPLTIYSQQDSSGVGTGYDRADLVGPTHIFDPRSLHTFSADCTGGALASDVHFYFDPTAYNCTGVAPLTFGNAGRNTVRGPGFSQIDVAASKTVGSLFHTQSWYVAPPAPPPVPVVEVAPPPPTAPPLPFTVMGSYARPGDSTVYFLTRGDRVFDVHVGDTIDNTYSVDSAANGQLQLTYKPLNIQQALPLGVSQ